MKTIEFWAGLVGAIILALYIAIRVQGEAQTKVTSAIEYTGLVIIFLFGYMILAGIASGKIDISRILEEPSTPNGDKTGDKTDAGDDKRGKASMSRFQLLVFTFVIAISLFLIVVNSKDKFPDIPTNVLLLLGISGTTYGVSKAIQASPTSGSNGNGGQEGDGADKKPH